MYLIVSISVLLVSSLLFRRVAGSLELTKLNMISWIFYYNLIAQSFIASVLVIYGLDNHYVINRVGDEAKFYGWLAVQYTMIAVPLGMLLAIYLNGYKSNRRIFFLYINAPIAPSFSFKDSYIKIPLYCLSGISVLAVLYTLAMLRVNPLIVAVSGSDALTLAGLRIEASRGFSGNIYVRNILAIGLTPVLAYISFAYWKLTRAKIDLVWFFMMFVSSFFILTYNLAKGPFVAFVLGYLFLIILINGGVSKKLFYSFALLALILIVSAYFLVMDVFDPLALFSYNSGVGGRILLSQSAGTYMAFEHFPKTHDFIGFASVSGFLNNIFGAQGSDTAARILMTIFRPSHVEDGTAGVMNSLFIAEAWANFGLIGVLVAPVYVGFVIQLLFIFFVKFRKTPVMLGLLAYLSYKLPVTGGVVAFFYNPGLMLIFAFFISAYIVGMLLQTFQRKSCENNFSSPVTT